MAAIEDGEVVDEYDADEDDADEDDAIEDNAVEDNEVALEECVEEGDDIPKDGDWWEADFGVDELELEAQPEEPEEPEEDLAQQVQKHCQLESKHNYY